MFSRIKKFALTSAMLVVMFSILIASVCAGELIDYSSSLVRVGLYYSTTALKSVDISNSGGFSIFVSEDSYEPVMIDVSMLHVDVNGGALRISTVFGSELASSDAGAKIYVYSANPDDTITVNGTSYYGGLEMYVDQNGKIVVINAVSIDDYLKGVLPSEVYPSWNIEALKAAAIVSRTYALRNAVNSSHQANDFDICSTTHCQMYTGRTKENERTNQAITETEGLVVMYGDELAMTPYHSSNGGYTETAAGAWGGSKDAYPYLTNVFTPYEDYRNVPNGKWENIVLPAELYKHVPESYRKTLTGKSYSFDITRDFSGFNEKMTVKDEFGNTLTLSTSGSVRGFFGDLVKSANFGIANTYVPSDNVSGSMTVITAQGTQEITGINGYEYITADGRYTCAGFKNVYVFDGQGYGHGVGLSQFGSRCMADAGFLYDEIVLTYFPGTDIISIYDLFTEPETEF